MKKTNLIMGMIVGCVILICAGPLLAQDWPQWRGPGRDGKVTGFTAPETWPKALTQKWKVAVGQGDSGPLLVGDKLYTFGRVGDEEVTKCLSAVDGKEVWSQGYAVPAISGPDSRAHVGPRSTPVVGDGKIVTLGVTGILICRDTAKGDELWRKEDIKSFPKFHVAMSPLILDGMLIAQLGGEGEGKGMIVALDLATGKEKWKWDAQGAAYASPVVATVVDGTKMIVTLTDKNVVGVSAADGKLLWQLPFAPTGMAYNAATPIVDGATVIFTGQGRGTKAVKIEKEGDGFAAKEVWPNPQVGTQFNTPVLKDGMLYGMSDKGNLFCLNAKDGKTVWTDTTKYSGYAAMLDAGSVLLALTEKAGLVAFKPGDKYEELAKLKVADSAAYAQPVVAGKNIYVKDGDSLVLWALE